MLVSQVGEIVDAINGVPKPVFWEVLNILERFSDVAWHRLGKIAGGSAW
jgi:hypothetical protein